MLRLLRHLGLRNALFGVCALSLLAVLVGAWLLVAHDAGLIAAIRRADVDAAMDGLQRTLGLAFLLGMLLLAVVLWIVSRVVVTRPLGRLLDAARRMTEADLTHSVETEGSDELAVLGVALNSIAQGLRDTLARVRGVGEAVGTVIDQLSRSGVQVSSGASAVLKQVEDTGRSMAEVMSTLQGAAGHVEGLQRSAEESSGRMAEMARSHDEVAQRVEEMAASVQETAASIEEMTHSILEVARSIEELGASTEETSVNIRQMDVSIGQVETNANETARLSEQVSADAATGVQALEKTLAGIDRIRESSQLASRVIEGLGRRVGEAAIIAAQAGEHGKGFAVVAEEIKELAERTGSSTKEIAELIARVQEESRNAVQAVEQGVRHVEEGVDLGREAEGALRKITASTNRSTLMVKAIARATVEQARGSKSVTVAVQRIAETVQAVGQSVQEQARGTARITQSAQRMQSMTQEVQRRSQDQAAESRHVHRAIVAIGERVQQLTRAAHDQTHTSAQVVRTMEAIRGVSEEQTRSVRQLEEAITQLQQSAEVLRAEVRRFRV